ncbi:MAG: hypothetical protein NC209_04885 [Alistipes sp.]|nr:hypothetical protein [Alistipes sp.]
MTVHASSVGFARFRPGHAGNFSDAPERFSDEKSSTTIFRLKPQARMRTVASEKLNSRRTKGEAEKNSYSDFGGNTLRVLCSRKYFRLHKTQLAVNVYSQKIRRQK